MALMLLQVLFLGVIAAAADDVPLTRYWTSRALVPCALPGAGRVLPRRPLPLLDDRPALNPFSWRLDDVEYNPTRVHWNGSLEIRRHEGSDGVLQCARATHAGTVLGYPLRLKTAHLGKFSAHPENFNARLGQPVALSCVIKSSPPAVISWTKDGEKLPEDDRYYLLKSQLLIADLRHSDIGFYRCTATNTYLNETRVSHGGRLKGYQSTEPLEPSFVPILDEQNVLVPEGGDIKLPCPVQAWPRRELIWELETPTEHISMDYEMDEVLIRPSMQQNKSGIYTCRVKDRSDLNKTFHVTVTRPVNITLLPASKAVLRASHVRFNCSADGNPAPNVTWYKDGVPLIIAGRIGLRKSIEKDRLANHQLIISSVTSNDAGVYQCFASNNVTMASAWAALNVTGTGAGAAPPTGVTCEPVGPRDVLVQWEPLVETVIAYTVHTTPQGSKGVSQPGQPHPYTQETVSSLKALTPYEFQVRAYVQSGKNVATDLSDVVVCHGQGVPIKLMKLDSGSVLVTWREFARETPGVLEWLLQWRLKDEELEHNVTLNADVINYTLPISKDESVEIRVLGTLSQPWLPQNLTGVPWYSADLSGDPNVLPRDLEVTQVGPTGFTVRWQTDEPVPVQYQTLVCVTKVDGNEDCQSTDKNSATIVNLEPDSEYEVRVQTRIPGREPSETLLLDHVTTLSEGADSFKVTYKFLNATTLRVSWSGRPAQYTVQYNNAQTHKPYAQWTTLTANGNTVLIPVTDPGAETNVRVVDPERSVQSVVLKVPPLIKDQDTKDLTYAFTKNGILVSWVGAGPRVVRFAQNITQPLDSWHLINVTESHILLVGLDPSLDTYVSVTAPGSVQQTQVLNIRTPWPDLYPSPSAVTIYIAVGVSSLCVLLCVLVSAICLWRRRKMAQSPVRSRRRNLSPSEVHEGESSEMKSIGGRLANGGAAGEPLLNGHVHITENPTSKTPNGKMRKARYEALDVSRHEPDTTVETVLDADASYGLFDTSRRPDLDASRSSRDLSTNNSFNKLPDDNMNSEMTRSNFALESSRLQPTLQPNG